MRVVSELGIGGRIMYLPPTLRHSYRARSYGTQRLHSEQRAYVA